MMDNKTFLTEATTMVMLSEGLMQSFFRVVYLVNIGF